MQTILVSAQLGGEEPKQKLRYFERLNEVLQQWNISILLLNLSGENPDTQLKVLEIPKIVYAAQSLPLLWRALPDSWFEKFDSGRDLEALILGSNLRRAELKLTFFRCFLYEIFLEHEPRLCILWNSFSPFHRVFADYCSKISVPVVFAEYGVLPGTIVFEQEGQMAESWVASKSKYFRSLTVDKADLDNADKALLWIREIQLTRKPQSSKYDLDSFFDHYRSADRKVIFYAGQNDVHSGILPRSAPESYIHSPHFDNTLEALEYIAAMGRRKGWHILFKPHPLEDSAIYSKIVCDLQNVTMVPNANIFICMAASNVTVTIVSQVSYMALIHQAPCILLGRNQLSEKNCAYELEDKNSGEALIQKAIAQGFTENQKAFFRKHTAQLLRYYLFSFDEREFSWGRKIDEVAQYLNNHIRKTMHTRYDKKIIKERKKAGKIFSMTSLVYKLLKSVSKKYYLYFDK